MNALSRKLSEPTCQKYRFLFKQLTAFAEDKGLRFVHELDDLDLLDQFRAAWNDQAISALKKLERLRAFFRFCVDREWISRNTAAKLDRPQVRIVQKYPFTEKEMEQILRVLEIYPDAYGNLGGDNARRLRALTLLLRYSGLRIGDAVKLPRSRITEDGKLLLYTQKTGVPVYCPLPEFVIDALEEVAHLSPNSEYFFWSGRGRHHSVVGNWQRSFRKLFALAAFTKEDRAHPHRFRHTYAVALLEASVPIDRVSVLLGHSSVRVTERHYAPWVKARQEQLEADVRRAWTADPIARSLDTNLIQQPAAGLATGCKPKKRKEVREEIEWWRRRESQRRTQETGASALIEST